MKAARLQLYLSENSTEIVLKNQIYVILCEEIEELLKPYQNESTCSFSFLFSYHSYANIKISED